MARRRKKGAAVFTEFLDDAVDTLADRLIDGAAGAFDSLRQQAFNQQLDTLPDDYLASLFRCAGCQKEFPIGSMEQVHPTNSWGTCRGCYEFMYKAGVQKAKELAHRAAQARRRTGATQGAQAPRSRFVPPPPPSGPPPWEVLGVDPDATIDQIKKAYRRKAMEYHPDRVSPQAPSQERENAKMMFQALTGARDAMLKVRSAPT
jgi:hypothetical protein